MAKEDLQNLDKDTLVNKLEEAQIEYFNWKEAVKTGKESNYGRLSPLRREVARIKTALQAKEQTSK